MYFPHLPRCHESLSSKLVRDCDWSLLRRVVYFYALLESEYFLHNVQIIKIKSFLTCLLIND